MKLHRQGSWFYCGLIAGCAQVLAVLALRRVNAIPIPAELVQDRLLQIVPGTVMARTIDTLRFDAKPLMLIGWESLQIVGSAVFGVLAGACVAARPPHRTVFALLPIALLAALLSWLSVEVVGFTLLGLGPAGIYAPAGVASALWSLPPAAVYALVLLAMGSLLDRTLDEHGESTTSPGRRIGRRKAMALALSAMVAPVTGAAIERVITRLGEQETRPRNGGTANGAEASVARGTVSAITPNAAFYVVSKNAIDPDLAADQWSLTIDGLVGESNRLTYHDLRALESTEMYATLECISNGVGGALMSTGLWRGVPVTKLLDLGGVPDEARWVVFSSADGYIQSIPLEVAFRPTTILAHTLNGEPLPAKHGFPARLVAAGRYGMKNPKWLTRIRLTRERFESYWERTGWDGDRGVETMARLDTRPSRALPYVPVRLGGVAFAGDRRIARVEISTDGGRCWAAADLLPPLSLNSWVLWTHTWRPGPPGDYRILVRAVDGAGTPQVREQRYTFPTGATGYDSLLVRVR